MTRYKPMERLILPALLAAGLLLPAPGKLAAQEVTVILSRSANSYQAALQGFKKAAEFKYEILNLETDPQAAGELSARAAGGKLAAVVTIGTEAAQAAGRMKSEVPVVYTMVLQPFQFNKPKTAGVIIKIGISEQLSRIPKLLPGKSRLGVIFNPDFSNDDIIEARKSAALYKLSLLAIPIGSPAELPAAVGKLTHETTDVVWMIVDELMATPPAFNALLQQSQQQKLPLLGLSQGQVKAGALAAFCADFGDVGAQTAEIAQAFLDGTGRPGVKNPRKVVVYVNDGVRQQLGLGNPSSLPDVQVIR